MQKNKLVSVVIPVRNRFELLLPSLESVFLQDYPFIEIILVDDFSTPSIKNFLEKNKPSYLKKVKLIVNRNNLGPAVSRNIGMKNATGEYYIFLDSDDILKPNFVSKIVEVVEHSKFDIYTSFLKPRFMGKFRPFYLMLSLVRNLCFYLSYLFNNRELPVSFFYMTRLSGMIFSKNAINNIMFDPSYMSAEDWKFVWECIDKNNSKIGILPKSLVDFTYNSGSLTLARNNYFGNYISLLSLLPLSLKNSFGIKLFQMYTSYVNNSK